MFYPTVRQTLQGFNFVSNADINTLLYLAIFEVLIMIFKQANKQEICCSILGNG